jgi:microcystin degradation protein MlrC
MKRVLITSINHETNTFSSDIGDFERWAVGGYCDTEEMIDYYRGGTSYASGMIKAADELGIELVPTLGIGCAGPLITAEARDRVVGQYLKILKAEADRLDGLCLALHGAGAAEGTPDLEGYILRETRKTVGDEMPICVTLDLHGNITEEMAALADGLFGIKEYPHVDCVEAGYLAMSVLADLMDKKYEIETAVTKLPLFTNCCNACTFNMPMREFKEHVAAYKEENRLVDATYFHGFPYTDVDFAGASAVVVSRKGEGAKKHADILARYIWENRRKLDVELLLPDAAVDRALAIPGEGFVVINEASDNPGGGCPGDGTWLLTEFLKRDLPGTISDYILDPAIAKAAHEAGVGGKVSGMLGGHFDKIHGPSVPIEGFEVIALCDGKTVTKSPMGRGSALDFGPTALIRGGNVDIIVISRLCRQTMDDCLFDALGIDINDYRLIGVKSTAHYRAYFQPIAKACIPTNPAGIHTANYALLDYKNIKRPIYPLDEDAVF